MNFEGKTVLVTGASSGIGEACAEVFADLTAESDDFFLAEINPAGVELFKR